ncbi:C39 family peptidase [Candidatus Chlorohelix sp.]|uniref:C39 family peptidase n=1 Tax=Candidatus Chlorohelix sp. TaxID=3139201 RepID=UPI00303D8AA3
MSDTLTSVALPASGSFVATTGGLPGIYIVNGINVFHAITVDPSDLGLLPTSVNVDSVLSPDGAKLVYLMSDGALGSPILKLADLASLKATAIFQTFGSERYSYPVWSPDGAQLAVIKSTPTADPYGQPVSEIWLIPLDGSQPTKIYGDDAESITGFSSDGKKLYISSRGYGVGAAATYAEITLEGFKEHEFLLSDVLDGVNHNAYNLILCKIGDKDALIYSLSPSPYLQSNHATPIRAVDANSGAEIYTVNLEFAVTDINASPDNSLLAFSSRTFDAQGQVAGSTVWTVKTDGSEQPTMILSVQADVNYFDVVCWASDNSGVFAQVSSGVEFIGCDGSRRTVIDWNSSLQVTSIAADSIGGGVSAFSAGGNVDVLLSVPYIHQLHDTAPNFDGNWACGPTSSTMLLAAYGLLDQRNENYEWGLSPYGWYISNAYTNRRSISINRTQPDPKGHWVAGAYGACTNGGDAYGGLAADFVSKHGLGARSVTPNQDLVKQQLRNGKPVVLGTNVHGFGHVILVKGLTNEGKFICNDPYWRKKGGSDDIYAWWEFGFCPWMLLVDNPIPQSPVVSPPPVTQPQPPAVSPPPITQPQQPAIQDGVPAIVGDGTTQEQKARFVAAFKRNGGISALGTGQNAASQVAPPDNSRWVQEFNGGSFGQALISLDDRNDQPNASPIPVLQPAFVIEGQFLSKYRDAYNGSNGPLGSVMSDEFTNLEGLRQVNFEAGYIVWDTSKAQPNDAYAWADQFNGWKAEYFNNPGLLGSPSFIRDEPDLNYDFGTSGLEGGKLGIFPTNFSARWTKTVDFDSGNYRFTATIDDGFRLFLNGVAASGDNPNEYWRPSSLQTYSFDFSLSGPVTIVLEYFNGDSSSVAKLSWDKIG